MEELGQQNTKGEDDKNVAYKIAMLGDSTVGKSSLTYQFTTSEYICAYDLSLGKHPLYNSKRCIHAEVISNIYPLLSYFIIMTDDDYGQKTVSVLLNNQETDLEIIDHPACEMSVSKIIIIALKGCYEKTIEFDRLKRSVQHTTLIYLSSYIRLLIERLSSQRKEFYCI